MKKYNGFTLIEVMTVVVIIAILAAILFPVFVNARNRFANTNCIKNLHDIGVLVSLHRQSNDGFPSVSGLIEPGGMPSGGIAELGKLTNHPVSDFAWCERDAVYEDGWYSSSFDTVDSSYNYGYNYYGMVTTTDGLPFPITTLQAAKYLYNSPNIVTGLESVVPANNWDLGIFQTKKSTPLEGDWKPAGYYPALYNTTPPPNTIITFCPHHVKIFKNFSVLMLSGEVREISAVKAKYGSDKRYQGNQRKVVDWRVNSSAMLGNAIPPKSGAGISYYNPEYMPVVKTYTKRYKKNEWNVGWINTGITLNEGDLLMVRSRGFSKINDTDIFDTIDAKTTTVSGEITVKEGEVNAQIIVVNDCRTALTDYQNEAIQDPDILNGHKTSLKDAENLLNTLKAELTTLRKTAQHLAAQKDLYNSYAIIGGEPIFTIAGDPLTPPDSNGVRKGMLIGSLTGVDDNTVVPLGTNGSIIADADGSTFYVKITGLKPDYSGWCELNIAVVTYK